MHFNGRYETKILQKFEINVEVERTAIWKWDRFSMGANQEEEQNDEMTARNESSSNPENEKKEDK